MRINMADAGQFAPDLPKDNRIAVMIGSVYRMRIIGILNEPDVELYPTLEVIDRTHPPAEREHRFPIPIEIDEDDLADAARGELVMRVIYLEDNQVAEPVDTAGKPQRVLDLQRCGERRTAVFAEGLGIADRPVSEQEAEVKRVKDRILKRLQRAARGAP